jgi:FtsP/CotA-like multicopper oxidase with cupredoxin domain
MMGRDMRAMDPAELLFWGVMSLGVIVGFTTAFPFNVWMVQKSLKHGLMTQRPGHGGGREAVQHHADGGHEMHGGQAKPDAHAAAFAPTRPQIAAMAGVTALLLLAGMFTPGLRVNLSLGAKEVGGLVMPPGMIMGFNTSGEAMRDMSAVHPRQATFVAQPGERGDRTLTPRLENGVKVFDIEASVIRWSILAGETVEAYAYNRQIPGPRLDITEGDRVRINVRNSLPEPTTVHWHGLILPNEMDGPSNITQPPIPPGGSYVYEYTVGQHGTYFYHSHHDPDRQQGLGLYGALIIRPKSPEQEPKADLEHVIQLQEWLKREWLTYPAMNMEGAMPNFFTINGKAYPDTETISMKVGQTIKLRFVGTQAGFIHPMHVHGGPFEVVALDGQTLAKSARYSADTVNVGPGQRYDVIWTARKPGKWLVHCHIAHHTKNNNVEVRGGGGLTTIILVD